MLSKGDLSECIEEFLEKDMPRKIDIKSAFKVNITLDYSIIAVQLEKWENKFKIMKSKSLLRNQKVFIEDDLTKEEREIQGFIRSKARAEMVK